MGIERSRYAALLLMVIAGDAVAQDAAQRQRTAGPDGLRRRAQWNVSLTPADTGGGAIVRRVTAGSPAARARLAVGDRLVTLNGTALLGADEFSAAFGRVRGGDSVWARVVRAGARDTLLVRFTVDSVPHERIPGTSVVYGAVRSDRGYLVRTVVTRPEQGGGRRLPAVLFIPWLSCDPVEKPEPGNDGFAHMLRDVATHSGLLLMRVEKPGVGDSDGPDCRQAGLDDDLDAYRAALRALRAMPDVDTAKVFLLGGSIGGALAPILAAAAPDVVAGVIAVNGFSRTWYEHMLDIERRRLTLAGQSAADVNAAMRGFTRFYTGYLLDGRTPAQVLTANPELRPLWYDEPAHQYGRPAAYYHAVQRLDVESRVGDPRDASRSLVDRVGRVRLDHEQAGGRPCARDRDLDHAQPRAARRSPENRSRAHGLREHGCVVLGRASAIRRRSRTSHQRLAPSTSDKTVAGQQRAAVMRGLLSLLWS